MPTTRFANLPGTADPSPGRMRAFLLAPLLLASGCPDRTISELEPDQIGVESKVIPVHINRDLDLLFLIDKSPTMADEQAGLAANFPRFIEVLSQIEGGLPNLHLGVISQDLGAGGFTIPGGCGGTGDNGNLLAQPRLPGCQGPSGNFIADVENESGGRTTNYDGALADTFSCIATLGSVGCGFEQHLGSLEKALIGNPANAGFLRPNAFLAIVIISDEDDCTAHDTKVYNPDPNLSGELGPLADFRCFEWGWECDEGTMSRTAGDYTNCRPRTNSPYLHHPDHFVQRIKSAKADPDKIIVATMMGPRPQDLAPPERTAVRMGTIGGTQVPQVQPSCENGSQNAFPMPRLLRFQEQFKHNTFYSLCNNDLRAGLTQVADVIRRAIGNPCFESEVDTTDLDPTNPGLQLQCTVSEVANLNQQNQREMILPTCTMASEGVPSPASPQPCWYVERDATKCEIYPTQLKIVVYPEDRVTPSETHLVVQCVTDR
jgi:hypothetical protein